jgi:hypothetical protein
MDVRIRPITHAPDEITMGHVFWYYPAPKCDGISATANAEGFSPLIAIDRHYNWDRRVTTSASNACNAAGTVCVVPVTPTLLLVPATKGKSDTSFLIADLLAAACAAKIQKLHFTHFGFMQGHLPKQEVSAVLDYLFSNLSSIALQTIVIDVDSRVQFDFDQLMCG